MLVVSCIQCTETGPQPQPCRLQSCRHRKAEFKDEETFTDGEAFQKCLGHAVEVWKYDLEDSYLLPRKVADMCREEKSGKGMVFNKINVAQTKNSLFPLSGGLFKGDYGSHGAEFILLDVPETGARGVRGVKITGDLNVPFSETSFEVVDDRPLIIPEEAQKSLRDLATYMEIRGSTIVSIHHISEGN